MKKILFTILVCALAASSAFAQINFETTDWASVKAKALKENKPIFIDTYTSWCGPCKMMLKNIFPLPEVGKFFNNSFICYKVDAEKGEGIDIAKAYTVTGYPTYLFIDGNGKLLYRSSGSMPADKFIAEGKVALEQFSGKDISVWDKEYPKNKNNKEFLRGYIEKRNNLKIDNADLLDAYINLCKKNPDELFSIDFLPLIYGPSVKINAGGACSDFMLANAEKIADTFQQAGKGIGGKNKFLKNCYSLIIDYSVEKAIKIKDENLFQKALEVNQKIAELSADADKLSEYKYKTKYYAGTAQPEKLVEIAESYYAGLLAKVPQTLADDATNYEKTLVKLSAGEPLYKDKSTNDIATLLTYAKNKTISNLSYEIRNLAKALLIIKNEKWNTRALEMAFTAYTLFDNFSNTEVIAEIYYQIGNNNDAKFWIDLTLEKARSINRDVITERIKAKANQINQSGK